METSDHCPSCKITWEDDVEIPKKLMLLYSEEYSTVEKAEKTATSYGWTESNGKKFGVNVVGIEIWGGYDGVSYWRCKKCETIFDALTMKPHKGKLV